MNRVHIIGGKNHGKTTLVVDLVRELQGRGLRVGTIKHTHHEHELDTPGKDSHRHREAGAAAVGINSRSMNAVFWPPRPVDVASETEADPEAKYADFAPMFEQCDLVIVEGDSQASAIKLEVWRAELDTALLAEKDSSINAVITDDVAAKDFQVPTWPRSDLPVIASNLLALGFDDR